MDLNGFKLDRPLEDYEDKIIPIEGSNIERTDEQVGYWFNIAMKQFGVGEENGEEIHELGPRYRGVDYTNISLEEILEDNLFPKIRITDGNYQKFTDSLPGEKLTEVATESYKIDLVVFPNGWEGRDPFILIDPLGTYENGSNS